jgi:hypothetical protein
MDALTDILGHINTGNFDAAADAIIDHADDIDDVRAALIMGTVELIDPTFSGPAAAIRDALRDNTELEIF